ncbi:MAG: HAD-IA family hydrolase [Clostridia bacterium]|nr:HAD-IA family hydrolase [Clostridia bacterium]
MAKFDCVLLDFDGTVADTSEGIFEGIRYGIRMEGLPQPSPEDMRTFIGPPLNEGFRNHYPDISDEQVQQLIIHYRARYSVDGYYKFRLYDGMEDLLLTLRKEGIKTGIATSKPQVFIDHIAKTCDLEKYFDVIVGADADKLDSGKKEIIEKAFNMLKPSGCEKPLMVGDTKYDILGAKNAGVPSVAVTFGFGSVDEMIVAGATYVAKNCEEIKNIVLG